MRIEGLLIVQDVVMTVLNVTKATVQITDISALLLDNVIRIYRQNEQKVKANHGRVINSLNNYQNTNTNTNTNEKQTKEQQGGKKKSNSISKRYIKIK